MISRHLRLIRHLACAGLLLGAAMPASALPPAPFGGPPDFVLDMPATVDIGTFWQTCLTAPAGDLVLLVVGGSAGPTQTKLGLLDVGPPFIVVYPFLMPATSPLCFDHFVPCDPSLIGFTGYFQFAAIDPLHPAQSGLSNPASLTVNTSSCCEAFTQIGANFNGTAIPAGSTVWFNSIVNVKNVSAPTTVRFKDVTISFTADGTPHTLNLPTARIEYSATATGATTDYDELLDEWVTTVPLSYSGNAFLDGYALAVPGGLPGGIKDVTWSASFSSTMPGLTYQWKWASAVYSQFAADNDSIGVKPIDGSSVPSGYDNSDHAGTPENFKAYVTGGAMGGGGSNFTGSYSGTQSPSCP